jgi:hypothetical protein
MPELGLGSMQYHLRAAKIHGDQEPVKFMKVDKESGKEVVSKDAPLLTILNPRCNCNEPILSTHLSEEPSNRLLDSIPVKFSIFDL